jgi:hypothetical protein
MKQKAIIFILIITLFMLASCAIEKDREPIIRNQPTVQPAENEPAVPEQPKPELSCEDWVKSMFPEQWAYAQTATHEAQFTRENLVLQDAKWKDGSSIRGASFTKVAKGSLQGENINYYYSRPMYPGLEEKYGYSYSEDIIDPQGTILGKNAFTLRPYFRIIADLVKDENNTMGYAVKTRYLSLAMVEPNILSCERFGKK